ncbi:bifunctional riboflavin kinase/FAD synthetase [Brevibacterium ihuae]|uniref:bifunctional riboflavin kinase/FAD synthetase n=1 Tax=Brevibacterium ihuae TaxID=1631743 RepID=UPI000C794364|nr:bifunctional riboflavin kinase/FAD synthetase [Brevibacterium ihuae]
MEVFWELDRIPEEFGPTAVTLGNFDGVHRGHRAVLGELATLARARALTSLAVTFDPHPQTVHRPDTPAALIGALTDRLARMSETGVDAVLVQRYSLDFASRTPEEFVRDYLVGGLGARLVAVGRDVRFGRDNAGSIDTLRELSLTYGFEVVVIDDVGTDGRFSSTEVRRLLRAGDVRAAGDMLGSPHIVSGTVVHGDARGREMGFPTANLSPDATGLVPADGVYAGWAFFDADPERYPAAISIGTNPTFDGAERRVEAHIVDVAFPDLDVYGSGMTLEFVDRIRGQVTFDGMDALIAQMHRDIDDVRAVLGL